MQSPIGTEKWIEIINKIVDRLPVTIVTALVGVAVALLGATGGGIFGIPGDSIQGGWRSAFGLAGAILFLASLWKFWRIAEAPLGETKAEVSQPAQTHSLVITTPTKDSVDVDVSNELLGKSDYLEMIGFAGVISPKLSETGVWIWRQRVRRETKKRSYTLNESFVYPVNPKDIKENGSWSLKIPVHLETNDIRAEYKVWAVVPSRDTWLLFQDHRKNRAAFDEMEEEIKAKGLDIRRKWVPLPSDYLPSFLADTQDKIYRVVLRRA